MTITAKEVRRIRLKDLALSSERFARLVGVASGRTVRRWEAGSQDVPESVARMLALLMAMGERARVAFIRETLGDYPP